MLHLSAWNTFESLLQLCFWTVHLARNNIEKIPVQNMSVFSGLGSTLAKQFGKRDAVPFLAGAIGAFILLPKFAYDESNYAVRFINQFFSVIVQLRFFLFFCCLCKIFYNVSIHL